MARVLISGASGLIGSALRESLGQRGYAVTTLVRRPAHGSSEREWHPERPLEPETVTGFDAVIHLSGENVAGRWRNEKKLRIRDSRVTTTRNITQALVAADQRPSVFVCASAIGYYGNRGDENLTEKSGSGQGFLPEVCREWEAAADPARLAGIGVVNLRTGIVLSQRGGALKQMLLPFRLGLGGRLRGGRQWWSWIHIDDFVAAVLHILQSASDNLISGPVNMTAPNPVTNAEFTSMLGNELHRAAVFPVPGFAARLAFGNFADEGLLASAKVIPDKLLKSGFEFRYPDLARALTNLLSMQQT